ncbi:MAG: hypothetical protein Q7S81_03570 [bacterium]|nr:hypothetical protein [bacterium]
MAFIETPRKEFSPEEKEAAIERNISVEIERKLMEKYVPLLMLKKYNIPIYE